jgi:hypothetical protein
MKSTIFLLFLPFASLLAQEDFSLRNVAGGQFNLHFSKNNGDPVIDAMPNATYLDNPNRVLDIQPYAAWKVGRNMLLGFRLGIHSEMKRFTNSTPGGFFYTEKHFLTTYTIGAFSRHYLSPEKAFRFFLEPYLGYARNISLEDDSNGDKERQFFTNNYQLKTSPGVSYQLTPHFGFLVKLGQVGIQTGRINHDNGYENWYKDFFANFNLTSFALGVEYRW